MSEAMFEAVVFGFRKRIEALEAKIISLESASHAAPIPSVSTGPAVVPVPASSKLTRADIQTFMVKAGAAGDNVKVALARVALGFTEEDVNSLFARNYCGAASDLCKALYGGPLPEGPRARRGCRSAIRCSYTWTREDACRLIAEYIREGRG